MIIHAVSETTAQFGVGEITDTDRLGTRQIQMSISQRRWSMNWAKSIKGLFRLVREPTTVVPSRMTGLSGVGGMAILANWEMGARLVATFQLPWLKYPTSRS